MTRTPGIPASRVTRADQYVDGLATPSHTEKAMASCGSCSDGRTGLQPWHVQTTFKAPAHLPTSPPIAVWACTTSAGLHEAAYLFRRPAASRRVAASR